MLRIRRLDSTSAGAALTAVCCTDGRASYALQCYRNATTANMNTTATKMVAPQVPSSSSSSSSMRHFLYCSTTLPGGAPHGGGGGGGFHATRRNLRATNPNPQKPTPQLQTLKAAFSPADWGTFVKGMPDWEKDLAKAGFDTLDAKLVACGIGPLDTPRMATALLEYFKPDPMKTLTDAASPAGAPNEWRLSYPHDNRISLTPNLKALQKTFTLAERTITKNMKRYGNDPGNRDPLMIAVQAGMGIGKSHFIDIADQLLFVNKKKPLLLKVTYNRGQQLSEEKRAPDQSLYARLVIAVHQNVPPNSYHLIQTAMAEGKLTVKEVAKYIAAEAQGRDVIIAVDEISALTKDTQEIGFVLSAMTDVQKELCLTHKRGCIGIITALPSVNIQSASMRSLLSVSPIPLNHKESLALLKGTVPSQFTDSQLEEVYLYCQGHPRSLAMSAQLMNGRTMPKVPDVDEVAGKCAWNIEQGSTAGDVVEALKEQFLHPTPQLTGTMKELYNKAMVMKDDAGRYLIPPTMLFSDKKDTTNALKYVHQMFRSDHGTTAAKQLESVNCAWEYFRCQHKMDVVPKVNGILRGASPTTSAYRFKFDHTKIPVTDSVLADVDVDKNFKSIDPLSFYMPSYVSHRAFESMCVAADITDTEQTLCLFQSKINIDLPTAIAKLE